MLIILPIFKLQSLKVFKILTVNTLISIILHISQKFNPAPIWIILLILQHPSCPQFNNEQKLPDEHIPHTAQL